MQDAGMGNSEGLVNRKEAFILIDNEKWTLAKKLQEDQTIER